MQDRTPLNHAEEWWRKRLGRVIAGDDEVVTRALLSRKPVSGGSRAVLWRAWSVERHWRLNDGPQIVVKAVGNRKSLSGTRACIRYVGRRRATDSKPVAVFDEFGCTVDPLAALRDWDPLEDHENLSRQARDDADKGVGWAERRRLHYVQSHHLIVSVPASVLKEVPNGAEMFDRAALAAIDEAFTAKGYRVLWGRHDDKPDHPHVHLVVKAVSRFGERLRFDRHGHVFDHLRQVFADNFCRAGLKVQAVRREDVYETRTAIMAGQQELRPRSTRFDGDLATRAPHWVAVFGRDVLKTGRGEAEKAPWWSRLRRKKKPQPVINVPAVYEDAVGAMSQHYSDPVQALHRWLVLARGGQGKPERALAIWYLRHRPEVFGAQINGPREQSTEKVVNDLRRLPLPPPLMSEGYRNNDNLVHWTENRRKRRIRRDRQELICSLWRLASQVVSGAHPNPWLAREILLRARSALNIAVQREMPVRIESSTEIADCNPVVALPADKPGASDCGTKSEALAPVPPLVPQNHRAVSCPWPRGKSLSF